VTAHATFTTPRDVCILAVKRNVALKHEIGYVKSDAISDFDERKKMKNETH